VKFKGFKRDIPFVVWGSGVKGARESKPLPLTLLSSISLRKEIDIKEKNIKNNIFINPYFFTQRKVHKRKIIIIFPLLKKLSKTLHLGFVRGRFV